jgi:hypothetical protein
MGRQLSDKRGISLNAFSQACEYIESAGLQLFVTSFVRTSVGTTAALNVAQEVKIYG